MAIMIRDENTENNGPIQLKTSDVSKAIDAAWAYPELHFLVTMNYGDVKAWVDHAIDDYNKHSLGAEEAPVATKLLAVRKWRKENRRQRLH